MAAGRITRIRAGWVVGYADGDHRLFERGEVVYQGDRVVYVGHDYQGPVDEEIGAPDALVGPGFVDLDALGDLDTTVLGFDNQPGWQKGRVVAADWPRRDLLSREQLDFNKLYAYTHLLLNGITSALPITSILYREWAEDLDEYRHAADVAESLGIRMWLGPAFMSGHNVVEANGSIGARFDEKRGISGLDDAVTFAQEIRARGNSLLSAALTPDRIEGCTEGLLRALSQAVNELQCPTRLHCCQSELEVNEIAARFGGRSSLQVLDDFGLLHHHMLLPHGQFLGGKHPTTQSIEQDIARLASSGASLVACPLVSGRHAKYMEQYGALRQAKVNIALGTDTFPPDMVTNMHLGTILSRVVSGNVSAASAADYYRMATIGGADALGRPDLGRLCAGAQADITFYDLSQPATGQVFDPITAMVINGNGRDISHVIVAGEKVLWDRQLVKRRIDLDHLHRQAQKQFGELMQTYPERSFLHPPVEEIFRPSFDVAQRLK